MGTVSVEGDTMVVGTVSVSTVDEIKVAVTVELTGTVSVFVLGDSV